MVSLSKHLHPYFFNMTCKVCRYVTWLLVEKGEVVVFFSSKIYSNILLCTMSQVKKLVGRIAILTKHGVPLSDSRVEIRLALGLTCKQHKIFMQADWKTMYYMMPATYTQIHLLFYTNDIDLLGPEKHMIAQVMKLHVS